MSLKVNIIAQLKFELAYYDVTVQQVSHFTLGTLPVIIYLQSSMLGLLYQQTNNLLNCPKPIISE